MNFALEHVAWEACLLEPRADRALEAHARRVHGLPNPSLRYFSSVPWLARALVDLHPEHGLLIRLEQEVADLVSLVVSQENACRFCYAAVRALLWAQGMDKARIERVEQDLMSADLPPRTVAAIAFGRAQSRGGPPVARAAGAALREAGFDAEELREIAYAVAVTDFNNRVFTIPAVPTVPLERMPDQFLAQLLRPLIGRIVRRHRSRGREPPPRAVLPPPYARLGQVYEGSPIAPMLATTLDNMWASPHLTRRCKLLLLAVVTRGLMCETGALDVAQALRVEGLTDAALDRILNHLDGPELDPVERLLLPFARETIWYEPAMLQRHARALLERVSAQQLLEAIGVTSLGNGLCRMSAMVLAAP